MNIIKKTACRLLCDLRDELNIANLEHYIETKLDWRVVFYHTDKGDAMLRELDIDSDYANKVHGFCYKTDYAKCIFLDNSQDDAEKLRACVHEVGHILLGHLDSGKIQNKTQNEIDANIFVGYIFNSSKQDVARFKFANSKFFVVVATVLVMLLATYFAIAYQSGGTGNTPSTVGNKMVYITPTGTKYHAENCKFAGDGAYAVPLAQAKNDYAPCDYCNPDK